MTKHHDNLFVYDCDDDNDALEITDCWHGPVYM